MHLRYYIVLILFMLGSLNYAATEGRDKMTEEADTFQLGRYVVELSLPKESVVALAKESIPEVPRMGGILLDSLNKKEAGPIYIADITMTSCCGIGYHPDKEERLIETHELPNTFIVKLFHTSKGYLIEAVSDKY